MEKKLTSQLNGSPSVTNKLKNGFRLTGWFKRGEIEELARTAAAISEAVDPLSGPVASEAVVEDSTITTKDHERLSLKTPGMQSIQNFQSGPLPAELTANRMSDKQVIAELNGSRLYLIGGCVFGLGAVAATICYFHFR